MLKLGWKRTLICLLAVSALMLVFLFQRFDYSQLFFEELSGPKAFMFNRLIRYLINDNLVILLIFGLFYDKKYVKFALLVELFGLLFLLIPYFILRFQTDIDHMQLSFLHRLIVNPTLMLLLIPAIYLQEKRA